MSLCLGCVGKVFRYLNASIVFRCLQDIMMFWDLGFGFRCVGTMGHAISVFMSFVCGMGLGVCM